MTDLSSWDSMESQIARVTTNESAYIFVLGILFSMPVYHWIKHQLSDVSNDRNLATLSLIFLPRFLFLASILFISILKIASSTYNPFIYFRF